MDKRYLIIIGVIVGLVIIGLIVFWVYFAKPAPATQPAFPDGGTFPAAGGKTPGQATTPGAAPTPTIISPGPLKPLTQLTQKPISGATFVEKTNPDKTKIETVRYFEKATGHIYDVELPKGNPVRISNTTIPNIFEVYWSPNGDQAVIRYTEENETGVQDVVRNFSVISIATTTAATTTRGIFLLSSIKTLASSPKENSIFYLTPFEDTNVGVTATFEDKKQKQILSAPFGDWLASWPSASIIAFLSKPSAAVNGFLYKLDPTTGSFNRVLDNIQGLTALWSPDGGSILYGEETLQGLKTSLFDVKGKKAALFSLTTLPEKCAWSKLKKGILYCAVPSSVPAGAYPDDWYQGLVSFSDRIWRIDIINGSTEILSNETNDGLDLINLFLSKNEDYLFFQNKKDGTLWNLQVSS